MNDDNRTKQELLEEISRLQENIAQAEAETNARIRAFFDFALLGWLVYKPGQGFTRANKKACEMIGYTAEELETMNWQDLIHLHDLDKSANMIDVLESGSIEEDTYEHRILRKDGSNICASITFKSIKNELDKVFQYFVIIQDISSRKKKEALQKEWLSFVKFNPNPILKYNLEGIILLANKAAHNLFDIKQLTGLHITEIFTRIEENVFLSAIKTNKVTKFEYEFHKGIFSISIQPLENTLEAHLYFHDITLLKSIESQLNENMEKLENVINNANAIIYTLNTERKFTFISPSVKELLGYEPNEILDKDFSELIYQDDVEKVLNRFYSIINQREVVKDLEYRIKHKNGNYLWQRTNASLALVNHDKQKIVIGSAYDVTEKIIAREELIRAKQIAEETNKLKTIIIENMGHELRTPLNSIFGYTELLQNVITDSTQQRYVQNIKISSLRLYKTLTLLMQLSKIEADPTKLDIQEINIVDFVREHIAYYGGAIKEKSLFLHLIIKNEILNSYIDEKLFSEVLRQLMDNAIKFTKEGGITVELDIVVEGERKWSEIKLIDTGIGFKEDYYHRIFEAFRQGSEGTTRNFEGIGLGLHFVFKIINLLNGKINIESKQRLGTTITLKFPNNTSE